MSDAMIQKLEDNFADFQRLIAALVEHGPHEPLTEFRLSFENIVLSRANLLTVLRQQMEQDGIDSVAYRQIPPDIANCVKECLFGAEENCE